MRTSNPLISPSITECAECTGVSRHGGFEQFDHSGQPGYRDETREALRKTDEVCVDAFRGHRSGTSV